MCGRPKGLGSGVIVRCMERFIRQHVRKFKPRIKQIMDEEGVN